MHFFPMVKGDELHMGSDKECLLISYERTETKMQLICYLTVSILNFCCFVAGAKTVGQNACATFELGEKN